MRRDWRRFDGIEVMRLCERETEKIFRFRLSSCDRENCDKESMILNTYLQCLLWDYM